MILADTGYNIILNDFINLTVTEKTRYTDKEILLQAFFFIVVVFEHIEEIRDAFDTADVHSVFHTPLKCCLLVLSEIYSRIFKDDFQYFSEQSLVRFIRVAALIDGKSVALYIDEHVAYSLGGKHEIHRSCLNGRIDHTVKLRCFRVLDDDCSACFLDCLNTFGAVGACA